MSLFENAPTQFTAGQSFENLVRPLVKTLEYGSLPSSILIVVVDNDLPTLDSSAVYLNERISFRWRQWIGVG
jgi:hypothetical protein